MMWLLSILFLFSAQWVEATPNPIQIDSKIFYQGKRMGAPRIIAKMDRRARVVAGNSQVEYSLEVTPRSVGKNNMELVYLVKVKENDGELITRGRVSLQDKKQSRILLDRGRVEIHLDVKKS